MLRQQQVISTSQLAASISIGRENIEALESGKLDPTYELLVAVAEGLGTSPSALVMLAERLEQADQP